MKYDNIIAIDPDKDKSGVAFLKPKTRQLEVTNLTFPLLLDYLQHVKGVHDETKESLIVVVEAGWMVKKVISMMRKDTGRKRLQRMSERITKPGARLLKCAVIMESRCWNTPHWSSVGKGVTERLRMKN